MITKLCAVFYFKTFYLEIIYCATNPCDKNATCQEGNLKPICTCHTGYSGDGFTCANIDECKGINDLGKKYILHHDFQKE